MDWSDQDVISVILHRISGETASGVHDQDLDWGSLSNLALFSVK